jgi:D-alanyl-D-alanine carboxypeptidase/D-alanyl-D-alanine-endopeptidase (penicillin-binding protein 4)
VEVQELGAASPHLAVNSNHPFNPASTMKLVTTFAAMELLGPTYTWKTEVWADGPLNNGVLDGNLVIRGRGDPKLNLENLWLLAKHVRERGVREIHGDLVLDRSAFESAAFDPGAFDNDPTRPYNVGPDALLANLKVVRFTFVPDAASGRAAVIAEPRLAQMDVAANVRLSGEACSADWDDRIKPEFQTAAAGGVRVVFGGSYAAACGEKTWNASVLSPNAYFEGLFRALWGEVGGTLQGRVRDGMVPAGARLVYTHESPPLAEVVRDINKFSNNVMARQVFLGIGLEKAGLEKTATGPDKPGPAASTRLSTDAVNAWLAERHLDLPGLVLDNGSGLSRSERITAAGMGRLLQAIYASSVMPEMLASLPIVALDGTMRRRFRDEQLAGQAHIKTGTLSDARAIAGYVFASSGRRYSVVFIVNGPNASQSRTAQDALLRWVYGL